MKNLLCCMFLISCSSYITRFHKEIDKKDLSKQQQKKSFNKFNQFREKRPSNRKSASLSTQNTQVVAPVVKREYTSKKERRYRREDFRDSASNGSLWTSNDGGNFLFDTKIKKRIGDIVLINIQEELKKEITTELARDYDMRFKLFDKNKNSKGAKNIRRSSANASTIHDKISTIVIEEINKDHLLLKGQKQLLYRNRKRLVELQALVTRRSVSSEDAISSKDILETDISIIR